VAAFVYVAGPPPRFLLLRRTEMLGGFWQPITGRVDAGEPPQDAAVREVAEETGIESFTRVLDLDFSYTSPANGVTCVERCFALEVAPDTAVTLSGEHTAFRWRRYYDALRLLHYEEYREALRRLYALLQRRA